MSELILKPSLEQKCIGLSVARGLKYDPGTGILVPMNRAGQLWDPSEAATGDNTPARNREWYGRDQSSLFNVNYIIHTRRMALDFFVPDGFLDFNRFEISDIKLRLYCNGRFPNGGGTTPSFILRIFERGTVTSTKLYDVMVGDEYNLYHQLDNGTLLGSQTVGAVGWYEWDITDSGFISRIENTYENRGHISLGIVDLNECNYPTWTEDTMVPGYDRRVNDSSFDHNDYVLGTFALFESNKQYLPQLVITYNLKDEPGKINSMSLDNTGSKISSQITGEVNISDSESETQTLEVQARYALPGGSYGDYVTIDTYSAATPDPSGTDYTWDADVDIPVQEHNLIYSLNNWVYDNTPSAINASFTGISWLFSGLGSVSERWEAGRLKPNTNYTVSINATGAVELSVSGHGSETGTNPSITFNSGVGDIDISVDGSGGVQITDIELVEDPNDPNTSYYNAQFRARCTEVGQTGTWFYPIGTLAIDNRIPTDPVITEASSSDGVFQGTTPSGSFSWTQSTSPAGISGYYAAFSTSKYQQLSSSNASFVDPNDRTYSAIAPIEGKWYLSVAPITNTGLVGNTVSYGFFYNTPEQFVEASGLVVNNTQLSPTTNSWVANADNPKFEWTPPESKPGNSYSYDLKCGYQGGVTGKSIEHNIDWDLIDVSATVGFFKLTIKDDAGIIYLTKTTEDSIANWEWFDGAWHPLEDPNDVGLLRSTGATKIRYNLQTTDSVPDRISLHSYIQIGWFDVGSGGIMDYSILYDPKTLYFGADDRGYLPAAVDSYGFTYTGNVKIKVGITVDGGAEELYLSQTKPVGMLWRPTASDEWREFDVNGVVASGSHLYRINIEPYMNVPPNSTAQLRWKFVLDGSEEASWRQTLTGLSTSLPDAGIIWTMTDPEIDVTGLTSPEYIHGIPLTQISTTYYAKVRVFDGFQYSDWSSIYKFKVNSPPESPKGLRIV